MKKVEDIYPLSPMQRGMLFHSLYAPEEGVYVTQMSCELVGELDLGAFRGAWEQVVERHPILRTGFVVEGLDEPLQVVRRQVKLKLAVEDWRGEDAEEIERRLAGFLAADRRKGFDMAKPPLMRLALFRTADEVHRCVWTSHHILLDGWCLTVLFEEVQQLYEAARRGLRVDLDRPRPYREYIAWLQKQDPSTAEEFWRRLLEGVDEPTRVLVGPEAERRLAGGAAEPELRENEPEVPEAEEPRGEASDYAEQGVVLSRAQTVELKALAQRLELTPNTLVQGAWALFLGRYSGRDEVVFGSVVSGRPPDLPGAEDILGLFINTLPVRVGVRPDEPLIPWLKRLQSLQLEMRRYEYSQLTDIQRWSDMPPGEPLFEHMLAFQNAPHLGDGAQDAGGNGAGGGGPDGNGAGGNGSRPSLEIRDLKSDEKVNYGFSVAAEPGEELELTAAYYRPLYDDVTVTRMLRHFRNLLLGMTAGREPRLGDLPLLTAAERHQLIVEWSAPAAAPPPRGLGGERLLARIRAHAATRPEAPAVVTAEGEAWSYGRLVAEAEKLARRLAALGVEAETPVALYLERSPRLVMAQLAVLAAGGAYLPLDPGTPRQRLAFLLFDSAAPVVISERALAATLPAEGGATTLLLDREADAAAIAAEPPGSLDPGPLDPGPAAEHPERLVYLIYTSGSTGRPKGVAVALGGLLNLVDWHLRSFALAPGDRLTLFAGVAFDATVAEIWPALAAGACLCLPPDDARLDPETLIAWLAEAEIAYTFLPTPLTELALAAAWPPLPALRAINTAGDRLHRYHRPELGFALYNSYGPTEATVAATQGRVPRRAEGESARELPAIGAPIAGARVYLLDRHLRPVALGLPGEIAIAGAGVARGYLRRPRLTAERFLPDPFAHRPGARMYRTGDLGRWRSDGQLAFVGRLDHQVKVRGYRIELGEIEAALAAHPEVREAAVTASAEGERGARLVAYVVGGEDAEPPAAEALRSFLAERLPEYMLPSSFVPLAALPLTANGKVDRRALPAPDGDAGRGFVRPRTLSEELVAGVWSEVLGVEKVGALDNFFELGGHSLLATQVTSRLGQALGAEIGLRDLFEHPTVAGLARAAEVAKRRGAGRARPELEPAPRDGELPLSFAQQRLWFLEQLDPGAAGYNMPLPLVARGPLDPRRVERALDRVAERHEVLRTRFGERDGRAVQIVDPPRRRPLPVVDLRRLPAQARLEEGRRLALADAARPFDLAAGAPWRTTLVLLAPDEALVLFAIHHIATDGWSMGLLTDEVSELYRADAEGREPELPPLAVQYADFAAWQRGWLSGETLEAEVAYWRERLGSSPPPLELPFDRPRPAAPTHRAGARALRLTAAELAALEALARKHDSTLFMVLLAALDALLARVTGQPRIAVGHAVAGRNHPAVEPLIGFFVNTLVLAAELGDDPPFRGLLARVREAALGAHDHQDLPFEKLVEELEPERDLEHTPLFQVMLVLQNAPGEALELPELVLEPLEGGERVAKFDLTLQAEELEGELDLMLEYRAELFDATTVERLLGQLRRLLAAAAAAPKTKVSELPLLAAAERHQLRLEWSEAPAPYPRDATVPSLFAAVAERFAGTTALVAGGEVLSYAELRARSLSLAGWLRRRGVGPETRVGLAAERSPRMVIALLAVLEAGGVYVPLPPEYPRARLAAMIEDAGVELVLADRELAAELPEGAAVEELEGALAAADAEAAEPGAPAGALDPGQLAYVVFTSGSTGRPKGVAVPHRAIVRLVRGAGYADLGAGQTFLQLAPVAFDASTLELWAPLLNGGRLALMPPGPVSPEAVGEAIAEHGVTTLWLTAGLFHLVADERAEALAPLEQLLAGGDVLSPARVEKVLELDPGPRVINGYGPTENTTFTACWPMRTAADVGASVPIGRPVSNTRVWVVERGGAQRPAPIGVAGELLTGGDGLARGYLGRPALTAERFVPDALSGEPGARLYRTGDAVRWLADGRLDFLGRRDGQVKIRGFRIETGEIEAALAALPEVRRAAVVARDAAGGKRLVAYVVPAAAGEGEPAEPPAIDGAALSRALAERLPDYMLPAAWVPLGELPLTANGKLDRAALPDPEGERPGAAYVAPRDAVETTLAAIWGEVLELDRVGAEDDFFELGGHSLLATQVMSRLRSALGVDLPLRRIFDTPTVAGLARAVAEARRTVAGKAPPPLVPAPRDGDLPLSFAQQRLWFIDQLDPGSPAYNIPMPLRAEGPLDRRVVERCLDRIRERHESLRTRFESHAGRPRQVIDPFRPTPLPTVELGALPEAAREAEAERLAAAHGARAFDLAAGPLIDVCLLRLAAERSAVLFNMHHIVSDGWSVGILIDEVTALYRAELEGVEPELPELPIQYADFAAWQRGWLSGEVLEAELAYWREQLAGAPPALDLATDRPRHPDMPLAAGARSLALDGELAAALAALARAHKTTLFTVTLAAFQFLLSRLSGQRDLNVGTPIAGRNRIETERLIGFFVNTLVLRARLGDDPRFAEHLERVRDQALDAQAHQEVPFEKLVEELEPRRDLDHSPLFQVLFNLEAAGREPLDLPELVLTPFDDEGGVAKFDLSLQVQELPHELMVGVEWVAALWDETSIERLLRRYRALLEGVAAEPTRRLSELSLLAAAEEQQLSREWALAAPLPAPAESVVERFRRIAAERGAATALVCGEATLSFAELDRRSDALAARVARALAESGAPAREPAVALAIERGLEMLVATLAIWKAGGVFVPLDPDYPPRRLAFMVEDSRPALALTRAELAERLPLGLELLVLDPDAEPAEPGEVVEPGDEPPPPLAADPRRAAYRIYTSGTTGRPKAVVVEHGSLAHTLAVVRRRFGFAPGDRMPMLAAYAFDISLLESWGVLLAGGAVEVLSREQVIDIEPLLDALGRATLVHALPSLMRRVVARASEAEEGGEGRAFPGVRRVFVGGDAVPGDLLRRLPETFPAARAEVLYGPTETTIVCTSYAVPRAGDEVRGLLGRPFPGVRAEVLGRNGETLPAGVPGELTISGPGVARGYLGRARTTAERFVPAARGEAPGARAYRTGDRARWLADGRLEFLGRDDEQVKVRGFRIELGEVESALREHPRVAEAVLVARAGASGEKQLVAYVVARAAEGDDGEAPRRAQPATGELRAHLGERLADHMLPERFVFLDELPLTATGKVDKQALPAPAGMRSDAAGTFVAPRTQTEGIVAAIWRDVLGLDRVGALDSFFDLGGHSLLATQVMSRLRGALGVELPLRAIFEGPTVAQLARAAESGRRGEGRQPPPLAPAPRGVELPLSFAQQRLWFIDQMEPGSSAYNMPMPSRAVGPLDVAAVERSLERLVRRHESLRTRFEERDGRPVQIVDPPAPRRVPVVDLGALPKDAAEAEGLRLVAHEGSLPFDLAAGPLLRTCLVRLAPEESLVLIDMHHIVSDGWSLNVFLDEMAEIYRAELAGTAPDLAEMPIQYADFALWQRSWLAGETLAAEVEFWRGLLGGSPPVLELPVDRPRSPDQEMKAGDRSLHLSRELSAALQRFCRERNSTLFLTFLAAVQLLLGRWAGQSRLTVGTPVAGRDRVETEPLIGFFVNTLVLPVDLEAHASFEGLLAAVRETALDAQAHQDVPFEKLVEELEPQRDLDHAPLFQVLFAVQNAQRPGNPEVADLELRPLTGKTGSAKFDLSVHVIEDPERIEVALEYVAALFDATTMARWLRHLETLLEAAVASPGAALDSLPSIPAAERHQLIREWRGAPLPPAEATSLAAPFLARAAESPEAPALWCEGRTLSYGELAGEVRALARRLAARGVGAETRVAVCLERSPELVVALLATLAAGGAYVPLDPAYPAERLAFMLEDSAAALVITRGAAERALPEGSGPPRLDPRPADDGDTPATDAGTPTALAGSLAYVIYTSGSTGRPKGVAIEHRSALAMLAWARAAFSRDELAGVLASTSVCFDLSVFELFVPLAAGGTVYLAADALALPATARAAGGGVRLLNTVPSAARQLADEAEWPESVRAVNLAGEALPGELVDRLYALGARVVRNLYGPSEDTTYSTWARVPEGGERPPAIGRPVAGTAAYVLDARGRATGLGVPGELYLAGAGLARGYLGRPALTAERFVPDPFAAQPGGRLYRTGDRVRWRGDGELDFLGRLDHQVKLRGFRIELGEVGAALAEHPAVGEAVATVHDTAAGPRLVAYAVTAAGEEGSAIGPRELRAYLGARLPAHMVPAEVIELEAMPRTPNGKIDRKALPAPAGVRGEAAGRYLAPRTQSEQLIAGVWAEVLGLDRVGVLDNFFELGGHSLLATQVRSRLRGRSGAELPLRAFFEGPTVAQMAKALEAARRAERGVEQPPLEPAPRDGELPLSFAQQRLWFIDQLEPGGAGYNMPLPLRARGPLVVAAVESALAAVVARHETLRTRFEAKDGKPRQIIEEPAPWRLPVVDLARLELAAAEALGLELAEREAGRPFDLARGPLLRTALVRLAADDALVLVTMHHIVSDGWSLEVLMREVAELYEAELAGDEPDLPELPVQYADFAAWQRGWLDGEVLAAEIAYWREQLGASPPVLRLPVDRPRSSEQEMLAADRSRVLPRELAERLRALAIDRGLTLFMVVLAGVEALLARWSGQPVLTVGTPVAGRNLLETEPLIGFFVNTLVLKADLGAAPTFSALLDQARDAVLDAQAHQEVPFEKLVEELEPERQLEHSPLFQVMFALQNAARGGGAQVEELELEPLPGKNKTAKYELSVHAMEESDGLEIAVEYVAALWDATTIGRFLLHLERLLQAAVADPERALAAIEVASPAERHQLAAEWPETRRPYPRRSTVHELVLERARRAPEAVAVVAVDGEELTYGRLAERATRLARRLVALGVRRGDAVALYLERSPRMIEALLAILEAGGWYLPLGVEYPGERLRFMLDDGGARLVLVEPGWRERPGAAELELEGRTIVELGTGDEVAAGAADEASELPAVDALDLAYVAYTSGSSGRPKGVAVPHRAVVRLVRESDYTELGAEPVVLQLSTISFDAATYEIWAPLAGGGRLVLMPPGVPTPEAIGERIAAGGVTHLFITAGLFHLVADERPEALAPLAHVLSGGEVLSPPRVRRVLELDGGPAFSNVYGPTESTTFATCQRRLHDAAEVADPIPIGRPIANTAAWVVDAALEPVPIGVVGELVLGGDGLARGYLGRPARTALSFVPSPWPTGESRGAGAAGGDRLYRTGDQVRWLADGQLEFVGRRDFQVKVRGFRIELGEIEAALVARPEVKRAVVVARDDAGGASRSLVAYVVAAEGAAPKRSALREALAESLPEHMLPGAFVVLDELPLNANGKVDRDALPAPESGRDAAAGAYLAPRDQTEELLAGVWQEVLGVERVGVRDNFFELGGHSLLATQVMSRLRSALGVDVPLRRLFEAPTVAGLARAVDAARRGEAGVQAPPIEPVPRDGELPLSFAQQRLWFIEQLEPGTPAYNVPLPMWARGELDLEAMEGALADVVARHEALRTRILTVDGKPRQVIDAPARFPVPVVDLRRLPEAARRAEGERLAEVEAMRPFDLERGPLLRGAVARLAADEHMALFSMHHIVSDGWSIGILVEEVSIFYRVRTGGDRAELDDLPELPVQYADFAAWQRGWLAGEVLEAELGYWRERLAGAPPVLELPKDRPRPQEPSMRGGSASLPLPPALTAKLRALCRERQATPFMALLAAFQAVLARWSGQHDVSVGTPVAGRNHLETEGLIGFFVNTLVLRTDLAGDPGFGELLEQVREHALEAQAHQELPFEKLVEELEPDRSLNHSPLFQVMFALQNAPGGDLDLAGLTLSPLEGGDESIAKFDLHLAVEEREEHFECQLEYAVELFDATTAARLLRHLRALLEGALADPERPVAELPLLTPAERHLVRVEWGAPPAPEPRRATPSWPTPRWPTLAAAFEQAAAAHAAAPALAWSRAGEDGEPELETLTYGELAARVQALAARLVARGVGPGTRVGVCLERTPRLVEAILATLAAGAAYVPIDPAYPRQRQLFMLDDSGAALLLAESATAEPFAAAAAETLRLDAAAEDEAQTSSESARVAREAGPGDLAYVIYTSGSTGRPKGVAIEHRSALALLDWAHRAFSAEELAGVVAATSVCFDLSVFELFAPLTAGGRAILVDDALAVAALPADAGARLLNTVPSALAQLAAGEAWPAELLAVNLAGEALSGELVRAIRARSPAATVRNLYGPSEDTTYSTWARVEPDERIPPIGRPLPGTRAHLVDARGRRVPLGVFGELLLGGDGLARGYLGRPALTAERFVPDPWGGHGERLYRTGDLVRWRAGGELEFLGRIDQQVKLRGFRIELGEVEAALVAEPAVVEAAAALRRAPGGDDRLVAYVTASADAAEAGELAAALRRALARRLPEHMLPSEIVVLEALPRTPNGKLDRRALPTPRWGSSAPVAAYRAPRTPTEAMLVETWSDLLGVDRVGIDDGFFDLGGHSLLATQALARLRGAFGVELPLRALFEGPTIAELAKAVERAQSAGSGTAAPPLVPLDREAAATLPLSFAQQRLWFIEQLQPENPLYNMPMPVRVAGPLSLALLARAIAGVIRRHEVLRTTFRTVDEQPVQVVHPPLPPLLPLVDLGALAPADAEAAARELVGNDAARPFDLHRGPLLRLAVLRLAADDHVVAATMHHIISDGWSLGVLVNDIGELYEAIRDGDAPDLAPLPIQYVDYAHWQREWLSGETLAAQIDFWRRQLEGAPPVLELPTDRPRPPVRGILGGARPFAFSERQAEALRAISRRHRVTVFMTLLALLKTLLARLSGQRDIVVGTPVAGRTHTETEPLIGFFVNNLVLRTDLADGPDLPALLERVREVTLEADAHQSLPFEKLVEELQPERSLAVTPIFQVMFVYQNTPRRPVELQQLRLDPFTGGDDDEGDGGVMAKFDLTLAVEELGDDLSGTLEYSRDLFDATTAERMVRHLQRLADAWLADPQLPFERVPLLSPAERQQLVEWNATGAPRPAAGGIYEAFAAQAERTPSALALAAGETRSTYAELAARVRALAARLAAAGVGAETRVAVCLERDARLPAALLAVLAAGGAYVPIDPAYPLERRRFMLEDSGAEAAITAGSLLADLGDAAAGLRVLDLDAEPLDAGDAPAPPPIAAGAGRLGYVIYTSGSTGRPKGVAIEQRSALALFDWADAHYGPDDLAGVLAATSVCFDLSVFELFLPLTRGGTVVLASDALALPDLAAEPPVRLVNTVPSALAELLEGPGLPASVRTVNLAGEALPRELVERIHARSSAERVLNLYGPSEDTTYSTWALVPSGEGAPPIGRPLAGTRAHVLDGELQPVPLGVAGELYLAGVGLARGYLGRPALTAERFLPDPFAPQPGGRIYRTGDLVRRRAGGDLDFLGRIDHQVKVRGFRIELGEIEAALRAADPVREAVVTAWKAPAGDQRLVAYVVPEAAPTEAGAEAAPAIPEDLEDTLPAQLKRHLGERLPAYMVPPYVVLLPAVPRTANGKLDRRRLPAPEGGEGLEGGYLAPRTELEARLAKIWEKLLDVHPIGVRTSFFDLGGHSLLGVRLLNHIEQATGKRLPVAALFKGPTIERLAAMIRGEGEEDLYASLVPIRERGEGPAMYWVHPVSGTVFFYRNLVEHLDDGRPHYGLQSQGLDGGVAPFNRVEDMAAHYVREIRGHQPEGPYHLGGWSFGGVIAYEMARQLADEGAEVAPLVLLDSKVPSPYDRVGARSDLAMLEAFALNFGLPLEIKMPFDEFIVMKFNDQLGYLLDQAKDSGHFPPEVELHQLRRFFQIFKMNFLAMPAYEPGPYDGEILLFKASEAVRKPIENPDDTFVDIGYRRLHEWASSFRARHWHRWTGHDHGWRKVSGAAVQVVRVAGNHFDMLSPEHIEGLATTLLSRLCGGSRPSGPGSDDQED